MQSFLAPRAWRQARTAVQKSTVVGVTGTSGTALLTESLAYIISQQKSVRRLTADKPARLAWHVAAGAAASLSTYIKLLTGKGRPDAAEVTIAVYPLGRPGDVDTAAKNLPPRIAAIAGLDSIRLDLFPDREAIVHEAASLIAVLPPETGIAVLPADDELKESLVRPLRGAVVWYGYAAGADVQLLRLVRRPRGGLAAEIAVAGARHELHLPHIIGRHQVHQLLAAVAAANAVGADVSQAAQDLQSWLPPSGYLQRLPGRHGAVVIDDTAETTPENTLQALETLADIAATDTHTRRRIAILGSIPHLGRQLSRFHQEIGQAAASAADIIITIGDEARLANEAAARSGQPCDVHHFPLPAQAAGYLAPLLKPGDTVLVKTQPQPGKDMINQLTAEAPYEVPTANSTKDTKP
ncbi:MAG: hypothetical protein COT71_00695 [Candidatus Andersenbacteria bacterium CG10_big_fil_rev_8_21_14_0_10_54_11]|uniref:Mur ligase central domain-containing protein n=1 Tax=Candidatus Andersenbacteria bacterium CG10_big_fil_rev_8_21_14_0_10_54_11 TaxID=1974485 RepID=A0A2M6X054_9BACT|nr:MAG: hypothetical protein COT71_00695 [Candidatus Andersenbacteria bacterium CG10_big_fil_rev_8_21_14_0_10_54_11]